MIMKKINILIVSKTVIKGKIKMITLSGLLILVAPSILLMIGAYLRIFKEENAKNEMHK